MLLIRSVNDTHNPIPFSVEKLKTLTNSRRHCASYCRYSLWLSLRLFWEDDFHLVSHCGLTTAIGRLLSSCKDCLNWVAKRKELEPIVKSILIVIAFSIWAFFAHEDKTPLPTGARPAKAFGNISAPAASCDYTFDLIS